MFKKKVLITLGVVLAFGLLGVGAAQAQEFRSGDNLSVGKTEKIDRTLFIAGNQISIDTDVDGDVFCAGQKITINGAVKGDVFCAGQDIKINGPVSGGVRLAGQNVEVNSLVEGSVSVASSTFDVGINGKIGKDITIAGDTANINGTVGRDLAFSGNRLNVNKEVGRNIKASSQNIALGSSAIVGGNLEYTSANDYSKAEGAKVDGSVQKYQPKKSEDSGAKSLAKFILGFVLPALLITSMILILVAPRIFYSTTNNALPTPWKALLFGIVVNIILPIFIILLAITVYGIPLAVLLLVAWVLLMILSGPVTAFYVGRLVMRRTNNVIWIMLVGSLVVVIAYLVPMVNFLMLMFVLWAGVGMVAMEFYRRMPKPSYVVPEMHSSKVLKPSKAKTIKK